MLEDIPTTEYKMKSLLRHISGATDCDTCEVYEACACGKYVWDHGDMTADCPKCPSSSDKHPKLNRVPFIVNNLSKWLQAQYSNRALAKTLHDFAEAPPIIGDYMAHGGIICITKDIL